MVVRLTIVQYPSNHVPLVHNKMLLFRIIFTIIVTNWYNYCVSFKNRMKIDVMIVFVVRHMHEAI